jgi:D-aspartate ligase
VARISDADSYTLTSDAAPYAGVDLGWAHYLDLIGRDVTPVAPDGRDFRHIVPLRDFVSMRGYLRAGQETWRSLLRSYRPPVVFLGLDLRDWRVSAGTLAGVARIIAGPALRRIFPGRKVK